MAVDDPRIEPISLQKTAQERYLNYAMSVITSRALPDVRDGLKPVQRRILYGMFSNLRLTHDAKPRKSAAIVGEVMGKYHPHGDQSIYDAMVRMAQDFSVRYTLVDGHGNFGSIDGDNAAAMRYTEARLAPIATELLTEIKKDTVDFRANYDATTDEPIVLPAQVPNLLINGATGIAVGMATNIPPHHLGEILGASIALIDDPKLETEDLVGEYVQGPDFPTGGVITNEPEEIVEIYKEGSGAIEVRSDWEIEKDGHKKYIIVTSVPYTVNKSTLVEKIASHIAGNKIPQVQDIRDESTDEVRIVMELKRGSDPEAAMAYLFKHTPLENRFHVNLTCLVPTENPLVPAPAKVDLKRMLREFLDFRFEVVTRRIEYDLAQLLDRIHILEGFELVFSDIDKVIEIVRNSESKKDAAEGLMDWFGCDAVQADAVLEIKLYRLAKLEITAILDELREKREEAAKLQKLLDSEVARWELIKQELLAIQSAYADPRRTRVGVEVRDLEYDEEKYIVDEKAFVIVTRDGWLKRQKSYTDLDKIRVRENDEVGWVFPTRTRHTVLFFTNMGRVYTMRVDDVISTTGYGDPLQAIFDFDDGEQVVGVVTDDERILREPMLEPPQADLLEGEDADDEEWTEPQMMAITEQGQAIRFAVTGYTEPSTVKGRLFMRLNDGDHVVNVEMCDGTENVAIASREGRGLMFAAEEVAFVKNPAKGVRAIALAKGDDVLDFTLCRSALEGLDVETNRGARVIIRATKSKFEPTSRNNKGRWVIKRGHLVRSHRPPLEVTLDSDSEAEDDFEASDDSEE
jgi:DNA gyrase subunit A